MSTIKVYQLNRSKLRNANHASIVHAYEQEFVTNLAIASALDFDAYEHAMTIEAEDVSEANLTQAWMVANDFVSADATLAWKSETANQAAKGDLFLAITEAGHKTAYICQGSWFDAYQGPLPILDEHMNLAAAV